MDDSLGSADNPLSVAIVGAGPSGFYAAGSLLNQRRITVRVDMFDRLPTPYGLVRYGVAPDHAKIKLVTQLFDRTMAASQFRFFGNVQIGKDLSIADLQTHYAARIYATGAQSDRRLGIPGEDLFGSLSATEFVAWYNGHPDYANLELPFPTSSAVVVGVGNVALDVARILSRSAAELANTDIALHAEKALAVSGIRDIYILARRGPAQAKFTLAELKELGELAEADVIIDPAELVLDATTAAQVAADPEAQRNLAHLQALAERPLMGKPRRIHLRFLVSPHEIIGEDGRVTAVQIEKNELLVQEDGTVVARGTGQFETIPAGLVLRAVGYRGLPLSGLPYDDRTGTLPNVAGRIIDPATKQPVSGDYVVGWAKRGPTGIIGTNKPDSLETVQNLLSDLYSLPPPAVSDPAAIERLLQERGVQFVTTEGWRLIDQAELAAGVAHRKPRVKFTSIAEMLAHAQSVAQPG